MCQSCQALMINKVLCHEIGCPDAWKDYKHECKWCGNEFIPEERNQNFCDQSCCNAYFGFPEEFED
jgi:hypothetical protein